MPSKNKAWHYGNLATSRRLRHTLETLIRYQERGADPDGWVSGRDIAMTTKTLALHSDMCALAFNGVKYEHKYGKALFLGYKPTYYRLRDIKGARRLLAGAAKGVKK